MKLCDPSVVIDRMSLGDKGNNAVVVDSAVEAATPVVEELLETPLQRTQRIDYFNAPCTLNTVYKSAGIKLRLKQGFVDTAAVYYLDAPAEVDPAAPPDAAGSGTYMLDKERGVVIPLVAPSQPAGNIVVVYTAGFDTAPVVPPATVPDRLTGLPDWLVEGAVQETIRILYADSQRFNAKDRPDRIFDVTRLAQSVLNNHHRPRAGLWFPQTTVVVP